MDPQLEEQQTRQEYEQYDDEDDDDDGGYGHAAMGDSTDDDWPAYFFPPLSQQRRIFCIDVLKREDIPSVCELGCGEGSVLRPMINGASHSDSFPEVYLEVPQLEVEDDVSDGIPIQTEESDAASESDAIRDEASDDQEMSAKPGPSSSSRSKTINTEILDKYKEIPLLRPQDKELHLRRIAGLDVVPALLEMAIEATAPPPPRPSSDMFAMDWDRWEDLRVELWQGSLDVYNDALDNFDSIIMTEVIEHLNEKTLAKFPEIVFGNYRPRLVVITTPNYDFNQFFQRKTSGKGKKKVDEEARHEFKDPTGRMERVFRDSDHKFEWTQEEFKEWCDSITSTYDYTVSISGVGSLRNYFGKGGFHAISDDGTPSRGIPDHIQEYINTCPGGDPSQFFATQTAIFRRKFAYESERPTRSPVQVPLAFYSSPKQKVSPLGLGRDTLHANGNGTGKGQARASSGGSVDSQERTPEPHKLLKTHFYKAVKEAGNPRNLCQIRAALEDVMRERMRLKSCSIRELWGRTEISRACGGYSNKIIEAIIQDPSCSWDIEYRPEVLERGAQIEDAVFLILKDFVEPEYTWQDPEEAEEAAAAEKKEKKLKWYERDLELEEEIQGMRIDGENETVGDKDNAMMQIEEDEWTNETPQHEQQQQDDAFGQDETWKAWDTPDPSPSGLPGVLAQEASGLGWGSDSEGEDDKTKTTIAAETPVVTGWDD